MNPNGRDLHAKAAKAREEEHFLESLDYNDQALFAYEGEDDSLGFAEGISCRSITLRVYANLHSSKRLLILAKYEMMAAVQIARDSKELTALALPLFNLACVLEDLNELNEAGEAYKEAVENIEKNPPASHDRTSVKANMHIHMEVCLYKNGDESALLRAEEALNALENSDEPDQYAKDVWVSGGYMRLAKVLIEKDAAKAQVYLAKAKEVIDANPALTLRKKQWDQLSSLIA